MSIELHPPERHLRLGGRAADHRVERLLSQLALREALEGGVQGDAILVVGQRPLDTVKVHPDGCGHVLTETKWRRVAVVGDKMNCIGSRKKALEIFRVPASL